VSAGNVLFIGASKELCEFESGMTAAWFGIVPAGMIGHLGTLIVVAIQRFPAIAQNRWAGRGVRVNKPRWSARETSLGLVWQQSRCGARGRSIQRE